VLTPLAARVSNNASGLAMDRLGRYLWVANYGWNTLSGFAIAANGALTPVVGSPLNSTYTLPYAIAAHPTLDFVYVAYQSGSHPVSVYSVDSASGALTLRQTLTYVISSANGVVIDPSGRFLYVDDGTGICSFAINATTGLLTSKGCVSVGGSTFALAIHPTGNYVYVANTSNNTVTVYAVNLTTGALTQVGTPAGVGSNPQGLAVDTAGTHLYVTNYISNDVSAFRIDASGATLTSLGAAVPAGSAPQGIALTP
jgi:6-phosphogluconolactonase